MNIEKQMKAKGYVKVKGMAIINDVAVTITLRGSFLSPTLSTQKSADVFNEEFGDSWELYRKSNQLGVKQWT